MKMVCMDSEVNVKNMDFEDQKSALFVSSFRELDSLLSSFRYLCSTGYKASLNLTCANGRTVVDFHVDLGFLQPPVEVPPPAASSPVQIRHKSPSYYRRLKRRRDARVSSNDQADVITVDVNSSAATADVPCDATDDIAEISELMCPADVQESVSSQNSFLEKEVSAKSNDVVVSTEYDDMKVVDGLKDEPPTNQGVKNQECTLMLSEVDRTTRGNEVLPPFDEKLSAIDNLRNLTRSLEAMGNRSHCIDTLPNSGYTVFPNVCENKR